MFCLKKEGIIEIKDYQNKGVLLKPLYTGICRTDIKVLNNEIETKNIILGHETSAIVMENTNKFKTGEIVSIIPFIGNQFMGLDIDGTISEFIKIPEKNLIKSLVEPKIAAFLEPIAASMAILNCKINKKEKGAIYGKNRISSLTKIIMLNEGYNIEYFEENKVYDYIVETEIPSFNIFKNIKYKGKFIIKSRNFNELKLIPNDIVMNEINILSAKYYDFNKSMLWLSKNYKLIEHLLGEEFSLKEYQKAFVDNGKNKNFINHTL